MNEIQFRKYIVNCFKTHTHMKLYQVENEILVGMPDLHYIDKESNGRTGWIELKVVDRETDKIKYRSAQPQWLIDYKDAGGSSWILLYIKDIKKIVLLHPYAAKKPDYMVLELSKKHNWFLGSYPLNPAAVLSLKASLTDHWNTGWL